MGRAVGNRPAHRLDRERIVPDALMLSREYRTIFVHVPKTGGQSIESVFLRVLGLTRETRAPLLLMPNPDPSRGPRRLAHLYASEYAALGYVSRKEFSSFFKFAVVRNPWARAVSLYKFRGRSQGIAFDRFVQEALVERREMPELDSRQVDAQTLYVHGEGGALLVDKVLRYENLAAEFAEASRRIFGREEPLPAANVSPDRRDYRMFYDEATVELVAKVYAADIEAFGYKFDRGA
jgi:hypothetical protein